MRQTTKELSLAAMMCALGAVIMCLGTVIPVATYICPVLSSLALVVVREECRKSYAWSAWAVISALSLLLAPDKEAAMLFAVLGYYPIIYPALGRIKPKLLRIAVKLAICAAATAVMYAVLIKIFMLEDLMAEGVWIFAATVILGIALFFLYDMLLPRMTLLYRYRLKRKK